MSDRGIGRAAMALCAVLCAAPPAAAEPDAGPAVRDRRFEATLLRPLFSPTRRPPPPPLAVPTEAVAPIALAPPPPPPPEPPPDVALSGIVLGGGGGVAILRRPADATPVHVALGGTLDGWTIAEIHPRAVVLRRDARSVTVELPTPGR